MHGTELQRIAYLFWQTRTTQQGFSTCLEVDSLPVSSQGIEYAFNVFVLLFEFAQSLENSGVTDQHGYDSHFFGLVD
jgi:hypothetical protein